jgi:cytochrome o ubiquinol oxidase subunit 1
MGATRRLDHYTDPTWQPLFITAFIGGMIIVSAVILQFYQVFISIKNRSKNLDHTGDPWNGRNLEWSVPSPAPFYNFAVIPEIKSKDAFWEMKKERLDRKKPKYEDIRIPKNTSTGIFTALFCFILGFAMVWHIWWLAIAGLLGAIIVIIIRSLDENTEYILKASEVEEIEASLGRNYD